MATFVLVHGGWAGGWVWEKVVPLMEAAGHRVAAPDMPGHGGDTTPTAAITLDSYVQRVCDVLDAQHEPAVLVGHSSGGVIVTQAAEASPDRVSRVVYLCAYLPADGQSLFDLGQTDPDGLVLPNLIVSPDGASARLPHDIIADALFADCPPDDLQRFVARMVDEPLAPVATPVKLTPDRYGRVPKTYLECRRDRAISPDLQHRMHTAVTGIEVATLDTGHLPQYAAPRSLAAHLSSHGYAGVDQVI